jgi:hypothetical protein
MTFQSAQLIELITFAAQWNLTFGIWNPFKTHQPLTNCLSTADIFFDNQSRISPEILIV